MVRIGPQAHLASYSTDTGIIFPGGKATEPEANHTSPVCVDVKNECICGCTLLVNLHAVHRENLHRRSQTSLVCVDVKNGYICGCTLFVNLHAVYRENLNRRSQITAE
jgi:hypothetical protein